MKTKIKFVTATTPFIAVATITPLLVLTACNKDNPTLTVDLSNTFTPSITQLTDKTGGYTTDEVLTQYYTDIKNNPRILAEDIATILYSSSTTSTGTAKIYISGIDTTNHTVSIKIYQDATTTIEQSKTRRATGYQEFINIPYSVKYDNTTSYHWFIVCGLTSETIKTTKTWSIQHHYTISKTGEQDIKEDFDADQNSTEEIKTKAITYIIQHLPSRYLAKCTYKDS